MNALRLGAHRIGYEVKVYFRRTDEIFFTFLFPVMMLAVFATAFSSMTMPGGISAADYYLPAMIASGILISGMQGLGIEVATERLDGTLKRLAGTPLPVGSYFVGKIGKVLITGVLQALLLVTLAAVAFGVSLPTDPGKWLTFTWVLLLGLVTCSWLGLGLARLPRSAKSASAVVLPFVLILQFISGVYLPFSQLPNWLQTFAAAFPLKWLAQGMRSVFLPDTYATVEPAGSWELGMVAIVIAAWLIVGAILTRITFRWIIKQ